MKEDLFTQYARSVILECDKEQKKILFNKSKNINPNSYNKISFFVLKTLLKTALEIKNSKKNILIKHNLAFLFLTDLCIKICNDLFIKLEEEKLNTDICVKNIIRSHFSIKDKSKKFIRNIIHNEKFLFSLRGKRVGYLGLTTFSWFELATILKKKDVLIFNADDKRKIFIPEMDFQISLINKNIDKLYGTSKKILHSNKSFNNSIITEEYFKKFKFLSHKEQKSKSIKIDHVISGSIGQDPRMRAYAMDFMSKNIHFSLIHHGAQYNIFNEQYQRMYEDIICDSKIIYGNVSKQKKMKTLGPTHNILGKKIKYHSRTDNFLIKIKKINSFNRLTSIRTIKQKKVLYFGTEFTGFRYGPNRDVHPILYSRWQRKLLDWLKVETGISPIVRLHPKRQTKIFDPLGYKDCKNFSIDNFADCDFFCIDYPTTSFAYVSATKKPVIFFDLGLRKLNRSAMKIIKKRCHYSKVDWNNFDASFKQIKKTFNNKVSDEFTDTFTYDGNSLNEANKVANFILNSSK